MINRQGTKRRIAHKIIPLFPEHKTYIEMFFGGGGMFFKKPKAKYNIVNDIDDDVYNLFCVIQNDKDRLLEYMKSIPIHETLFKHWAKNKETEPIKKATRFLFLATTSLYADYKTMQIKLVDSMWATQCGKIDYVNSFMDGVKFVKKDFRIFFSDITSRGQKEFDTSFIYADPPYIQTNSKGYCGFSKDDTADLFDVLMASGMRFAISEYDHPFVLELAKKHGLNVHIIGEVQAIKKRNTEI